MVRFALIRWTRMFANISFTVVQVKRVIIGYFQLSKFDICSTGTMPHQCTMLL
jgi:16S rRNA U516 pseudouridylate synthase RsuA-like enzyme